MKSIHAPIEQYPFGGRIFAAASNRPPCGGRVRGAFRILTASRDWQFGAISRADVADFLVRRIADRTPIGATPLLIS